MTGFWICMGMQLWKGSEYSRIPSMAGFSICKHCTRRWICQNMAEWCPIAGFCAWSTFHRVLTTGSGHQSLYHWGLTDKAMNLKFYYFSSNSIWNKGLAKKILLVEYILYTRPFVGDGWNSSVISDVPTRSWFL